ncbi:MAG: type II secretion system F family protein [Acidimicrobiia bacterium]
MKFLIFLLAAATGGSIAAALLLIFIRTDETLDGRLGAVGPVPDRDAAEFALALSPPMAENTLMQRAVDVTSRMATRAGVLTKIEGLLEQANLPLRPAEALFFYAAGVTLVGLLALLGAPSLPVGLMSVAVIAAVPVVVVKTLRQRRLRAFEAQLPDTLILLAGSLRAGYSFLQGVEAVVQEISDPMARELRRALAEARLGRPLEEALGDVSTRMQSRDFEWSVMAIRIQREVGGNLAELLQTVADTMLQRSRLRGEVKSLTAEGRLSAIIMAFLPVGLGGFMFMSSPDYIGELFSSLMGWAMVVGSTVLALAGFAWLKKIIAIEV